LSFKDLYKSANSNISGDRNLIDVIYEKAEKKPVFNFKYASLCAATLILVISLSVFPMLNKQSQKPKVEIAKKPPESITKPEKVKTPGNVYTPEEIEPENNNINAGDNYYKEAKKEDASDIQQETDVSMAALEDVQIEEDSTTGSTEMFSNGAGTPAIVKSAIRDDNLLNEQMTLSSYFEYLGIENLDFKSSLPLGMKFDIPEHVSLILNNETKVIEDDLIQFVAIDSADSQRIIVLSTSTKKQDNFHYDVITDINGISVKKHIDGDGIGSYFEYRRACITVQSYGVSEEELDIFLNSFLK
jgi:hypothetical protein